MEFGDIVYLAFATLMVIVLLHISVFWVSRIIQPPKPKIVYVQSPPPVLREAPPSIQVPTYETAPAAPAGSTPLAQLPPPIETKASK